MSNYSLSKSLDSLSKQHQKQLLWFKTFKDLIVLHKDIINRNFARTPKGIYVPEGKNYCLAAKKTLGDDYSNRDYEEPFYGKSGAWLFEYAPEKHDLGMNFATNKGLLFCAQNNIPFGFIWQTHNKENNSFKITAYKVLGLALARYDEGNNMFKFYGFNKDGFLRIPSK